MKKTQASASAFPAWDMTFNEKMPSLFSAGTSEGLTKREYFAAMAMQAYISANGDNDESIDTNNTAFWSVSFADALINELNKTA